MSIPITNFKDEEFCCKDNCGDCEVVLKLKEMLQIIRTAWGKPIIINSAKRCPKHNKAVGGVEDSQHLLGLAADITTNGNILIFYSFIKKLYKDGKIPDLGYIQLYRSKKFIHVDVRTPKSNTIKRL